MKKLLSIILTVLLLATLIGCVGPADKKDESSKAQETSMIEKTESIKKTQADKQVTVTEGAAQNKVEETVEEETDTKVTPEEQVSSKTETSQKTESKDKEKIEPQVQEVLSAEDKAVKEEIAKFVETNVDFRNERQITVQEKEIKANFYRVTEINDRKTVAYKNGNDTFEYYADNGELFLAFINSNCTEKNSQSIDIYMAEKIACEYAEQICDISDYKLDFTYEGKEDYTFGFSKYICGYDTDASLEIGVSFDGKITYIRDATDIFDGIEINVTSDWIDEKVQETIKSYDGAELKSVRIDVDNGAPCLNISMSIKQKQGDHEFTSSVVVVVPFE